MHAGKKPYPVHLSLHLDDDAPGFSLVSSLGQSAVKYFIRLHEIPCRPANELFLTNELGSQLGNQRLIRRLGQKLNDVRFNRFAHEARIHYGLK